MKITPPPGDIPEAREHAAHALYSLIMNVAEVTADGDMPTAGPDSLTKLGAAHVVDTIVHLVQIAAQENVCPVCQSMQEAASRHGVPFESNHRT
jgi:hypothetical protein